jgi:hypothetical protein
VVTRQIPWARIFAEGVAIVVSILLAFGIQAWWDEFQAGSRERSHLGALQAEFRENIDSLRSKITEHESLERSASALLSIGYGHAPVPSPDSVRSLVSGTFWIPAFSPLTTSYDNLVSTGELQLIGDEALQRLLATFFVQLERSRQEDWQREQYMSVVNPYLLAFDSPPLA